MIDTSKVKNQLIEIMMTSAGGVWHLLADQNPPRYGDYTVIKLGRSHHLDYDRLLWNGGSFVTHGHSLCNSVEAWKEEPGEEGT